MIAALLVTLISMGALVGLSAPLWVRPFNRKLRGARHIPNGGYVIGEGNIPDDYIDDVLYVVARALKVEYPDRKDKIQVFRNKTTVTFTNGPFRDQAGGLANGEVRGLHDMWVNGEGKTEEVRARIGHEAIHMYGKAAAGHPFTNHSKWPEWLKKLDSDITRGRK